MNGQHMALKLRLWHFGMMAVCSLGTAAIPAMAGQSGPESLFQAPEVVDIDDPFSRGINRIANQAAGGTDITSPYSDAMRQGDSGADLLGRGHDIALLASQYRVVGVAVPQSEAKAAIFQASNQDVLIGDKPLLAYVRLGIYDDEMTARQAAINLKSIIEPYLGAPFILRRNNNGDREETTTVLDIGPMRSVLHAERYCEMLIERSQGLIDDCYAAQEYPGFEPTKTFSSTAMLRAAPAAVAHVIQDQTLFNLPKSANHMITLREGDMLGNGAVNLVKVTPRGILIVAENGDVDLLPLDYVPERRFSADDDAITDEPAELPPSQS